MKPKSRRGWTSCKGSWLAHGEGWRRRAVQGQGARIGLRENHRHHHGAAGLEDRLLRCHLAQPAPDRCAADTRDGEGQRAHADRRLLRRGHAGVRRERLPRKKRPAVRRRLATRIQLSKSEVLDVAGKGREQFTFTRVARPAAAQRGLRAGSAQRAAKDALLLRMVPFVERNYNLVELGPRGTGKSHLFQQVSPYAHLISGGKATVAKMFVNNARTAQRGLVCQYDVVCFDEVSGVSFDQKDGVNIMKGYMESGEFSRGKESIRADGSIVLVGNFDVDVEHQQRVGHLFGPLPPEMRDDTAFMDRIHCFLPGWDVPKLNPGPVHRALRAGQRLPVGVLHPAAQPEPGVKLARPGSLGRCAVGP
jgi:hypothetical protein